jgi:hypothetical protein
MADIIMKKFLITCVLFFSVLNAGSHEEHPHHYKVQQKDYRFSRYFDMISEEGHQATVVKSSFHVRTNYDLYTKGGYQAKGICRFFCLGSLYSWGTEIDVYDAEDQWIGLIDGQVMTSAAARFSLYDQHGDLRAIAYLDEDCQGFNLSLPEQDTHTIARLERIYTQDKVDDWEVRVYEAEHVDKRILEIFSAFAVDTQASYKLDH